MDVIHQAILANTKSADALVASREVAETPAAPASTEIEDLHKSMPYPYPVSRYQDFPLLIPHYLEFDAMQTAIDKLTAALFQKIEAGVATTLFPSAFNNLGGHGATQEAKNTNEAETAVIEASKTTAEVPASEPAATNGEGSSEAPAAVTTTTEGAETNTTTGPSDTAEAPDDATSKVDNKTDDASTSAKATGAKPATKHVKRSSFFGGIFG